MANITLLLASESPDPPSEYEPADALLGANYSIPVLWLSLFTKGEIVSWPSTVDQAASYSAVIGRREAAITLSRRRIADWTALWPATFNELGQTWLTFVAAAKGEYLAIWTEELADMAKSADEWRATLSSYLDALDQPRGDVFKEVLAQSYLAVDPYGSRLVETNEGPIGLLAGGYSWATTAPWE